MSQLDFERASGWSRIDSARFTARLFRGSPDKVQVHNLSLSAVDWKLGEGLLFLMMFFLCSSSDEVRRRLKR